MGLDRRSFLQQTGLGLLTWAGLSCLEQEFSDLPWFSSYLQTLAQPTNRKLALLVGINDYPQNDLNGCLTDVELQKALLIHRFGFNKADILTITGKQATRENIETAFLEHLSQQANAGDVVFFHYSGFGSQVQLQALNNSDALNNTNTLSLVNGLVPIDGNLSNKPDAPMNYVLTETLSLLERSLATDKSIMVLDTSYAHRGSLLQGNLKVRSLPVTRGYISPEELAFQAQLKSGSKNPLSKKFKGIVINGASSNQIATEITCKCFSAGLFTYALTQYLWQVTPPSSISFVLSRARENIKLIIGNKQQPELSGNSKRNLAEYLNPEVFYPIQGLISAPENNGYCEIKLVGFPAIVVDNYHNYSCFTLASSSINLTEVMKPDYQGEPLFQTRIREGLQSKVKIIGSQKDIQIGQPLQELIRVLPSHLELSIALDSTLERIERVDATSAFASISGMNTVVTTGEQNADCLLGRLKQSQLSQEEELEEDNLMGGYGLFTIGGIPISNTFGEHSEAVKSAVSRLIPQFKATLAMKIWRLTINENSSRLNLMARLQLIEEQKNKILIERKTPYNTNNNYSQNKKVLVENQIDTLKISKGSKLQYQIENKGDRPIYCLLISMDYSGITNIFYSPQLNNRTIAPGTTDTIPYLDSTWQWIVNNPEGLIENIIICSSQPFPNTLEKIKASKKNKEQLVELSNPLEVAQALLKDLHIASNIPSELIASATDIYALDVNNWASLNFIYQVV